MNNKNYIRKAVEVADRWKIRMSALTENVEVVMPPIGVDTLEAMPKNVMFLDALAAQLRRQVDAIEDCWVETDNTGSGIYTINDWGNKVSVYCRDIWFENKPAEDTSMNLIKMIVDSKKLEPKDTSEDA